VQSLAISRQLGCFHMKALLQFRQYASVRRRQKLAAEILSGMISNSIVLGIKIMINKSIYESVLNITSL
jgi:hypothetical protein